jgi:CheY-like chemotaxis protein
MDFDRVSDPLITHNILNVEFCVRPGKTVCPPTRVARLVGISHPETHQRHAAVAVNSKTFLKPFGSITRLTFLNCRAQKRRAERPITQPQTKYDTSSYSLSIIPSSLPTNSTLRPAFLRPDPIRSNRANSTLSASKHVKPSAKRAHSFSIFQFSRLDCCLCGDSPGGGTIRPKPPYPNLRTGRSMKLLIVEDNEQLADITARLLRSINPATRRIETITLVGDLEAAIAHLPQHDAVLCDGRFPLSQNTPMAAEEWDVVRNEAWRRGIHFVLYSGCVRSLNGARQSQTPALSKPAPIEEIYTMVTGAGRSAFNVPRSASAGAGTGSSEMEANPPV